MKCDRAHLSTMINEDGCAILEASMGTITTLNSTGAFIWQALERGEALDTITANLARETGEPLRNVKPDVLKFVDAMKKAHLLAD